MSIKIKRFACNILYENCYVLSTPGRCVAIDPGFHGEDQLRELYDYLSGEGLKLEAILLTHAHFDHVIGVKAIQERYGVPVYMNPADEMILPEDVIYTDTLGIKGFDPSFKWTGVAWGEDLELAGIRFRAIASPGHTPGGTSWYCESEGAIFTGDTLFAGTIGRSDFPYSDYDAEMESILKNLMPLPGSTVVYPGHGDSTTIGRESATNPFLEPFNEKEEPFDPDLPGIEIHPFR